jgi:quercetin dioxygenase-like cupin family protein
MKVFQPADYTPEPGDPNTFTGTSTLTRMNGVCDDPSINVYRVEFESAARTHWHSHTGPQLLLVIEGRCRFQKEGAPIQEVSAGGAISIAPGEKHWHGATPNGRMVHLALNVNATTDWVEKVPDAQYEGRP